MLVLFNKPYGVLSQYTDSSGRPTLKQWLPWPGIYAAGRLDLDSEGLLVLTDDGGLIARLSGARARTIKRYLVQVEGEPQLVRLNRLRDGVQLNDGPARAVAVQVVEPPAWLWPRVPPVRFRLSVPTHFLELQIDQGRNRQVRRMTAAVGLPTLRLVRVAVGPYVLDGLEPGQWRVVDSARNERPTAVDPQDRRSRQQRPGQRR